MSEFGKTLARLTATIDARRGADPKASWSARLLSDRPLAAKKLAEEALEAALASIQDDRDAVIAESADLVYHWLVVLAAAGVTLDEVAAKLDERDGVSGIAEKASRKK
ncbi:phosphoribosyl-ATP diphosphatase [Caulobacter sp. KR2-114]|uniref:phosphoribosyl-ATP diphosphatase n=1 Tax=Caulobacter sp. KR2-114 TaxID=3400912 RepID=UPI003C0A3C71